jgi:hypothetical protein
MIGVVPSRCGNQGNGSYNRKSCNCCFSVHFVLRSFPIDYTRILSLKYRASYCLRNGDTFGAAQHEQRQD